MMKRDLPIPKLNPHELLKVLRSHSCSQIALFWLDLFERVGVPSYQYFPAGIYPHVSHIARIDLSDGTPTPFQWGDALETCFGPLDREAELFSILGPDEQEVRLDTLADAVKNDCITVLMSSLGGGKNGSTEEVYLPLLNKERVVTEALLAFSYRNTDAARNFDYAEHPLLETIAISSFCFR
tara:strand:- start:2126 stop:2671 length:546 start_codon:yes stop_codon:yes gene_type:complete